MTLLSGLISLLFSGGKLADGSTCGVKDIQYLGGNVKSYSFLHSRGM